MSLWSIVTLIFTCFSAAAEPSPDVIADPPAKTFLICPLHVHILSCADREDLNCKLTDETVMRVVGKVNGIWHKAGVHFRLEPILHEKAEHVEQFAAKTKEPFDPAANGSLGAYRVLAPEESRAASGFHVYYIHQFGVNGVFLGGVMCFIKETARLREVEGGIDEPLPRVTSHELGHAMGLPHRQNVTNLMASGTTGTKLNAAEVAIVRGKVSKVNGVLTLEQTEALADEADERPDIDRAALIRSDLKTIPR